MDRTFKSKIGWWYHLIIWILGICTILSFVKGQSPVNMITLLLVTLFLIHLMLTTWYKITADGVLIVHCSIFPHVIITGCHLYPQDNKVSSLH